MPQQQLLLGVGAKKKTYLEDVFSTYLYTGNDTSNRDIVNGIDLAGEGGFVWTKNRDSSSYGNNVFDTVRGVGKMLVTNTTGVEANEGNTLTTFNSNGFRINSDNNINKNNEDYTSWTFRKAKGFFDVIKYTGNGTAGRTVSHSLGSVPGLIMIKALDSATSWFTYHRDLGPSSYVMLNHSNAKASSQSWFMNDTTPTSSQFTLGGSTNVNGSGTEYIAYVFAGGAAATARSVDFDASGDYLTTDQSTDFAMGTGDFTVEGWFKYNDQGASNFGYFMNDSSGLGSTYGVHIAYQTLTGLNYYASGSSQSTNYHPTKGQWFHLALVRNSGTTSLYINGTIIHSASDNTNYGGERFIIGGYHSGSFLFSGKVSNFRVVKGTAVYTSDFKPTTKELTSISGTVLLCCNNSSTTGSTTGGTLTAEGDPTASTDSPFDDPAGLVFGDAKDQGLIKCGSYVGNGSGTGPEIDLGWEPQWILLKDTDASVNWRLHDSMRGIITNDNDRELEPNTSESEAKAERLDLTSTGFKINTSSGSHNDNNHVYAYVAIRRSDGYVGKPADAGTDVFTMDAGNASSTEAFTSGFPVDLALIKEFNGSSSWEVCARLIEEKYWTTNSTGGAGGSSPFTFQSNTGWLEDGSAYNSNYQSWMWSRRGQGFDVVNYKGNGTAGRKIRHGLGKAPQMIWTKKYNDNEDWAVYHEGLNGGTNPANWHLTLNDSSQAGESSIYWYNTVPTSTVFTVGGSNRVNNGSGLYISFLFSSVEKISKLGYYTGSGSSAKTITTGFTPRFIMIKSTDDSWGWAVFDSVRGLTNGSNADPVLYLNTSSEQGTGNNYITNVSSTGFTIMANSNLLNQNGDNYIYYAHA